MKHEKGSKSKLKVIQHELKSLANHLRDVLAPSHNHIQAFEALVMALQSVQLFLTLAESTLLSDLIPFMRALDEYFKAMQKGMSVKAGHLEMLSAISREFIQLSGTEIEKLPEYLQNRMPSFNSWISQLNKLNQGHELEPFQLIKEENSLENEALDQEKISFGKVKQLAMESIQVHQEENLPKEEMLQELVLDPIMFDLFRTELESQCAVLNQGLIELEQKTDPSLLEMLMRAAHSIKGAARVMSLSSIIRMAHVLEDCFVAAQQQQIELSVEKIDQLLQVVDFFLRLLKVNLTELYEWLKAQEMVIDKLVKQISSFTQIISALSQKTLLSTKRLEIPAKVTAVTKSSFKEASTKQDVVKPFQPTFSHDRILRVTAQSLNRLMGLAGESLVESRWLNPFEEMLQKLKKQHDQLADNVDLLRQNIKEKDLSTVAQTSLVTVQQGVNEVRYQLKERLGELDSFIRSHANLSDRLYQEVINSRMRPFGDGIEVFPRMVRDLARQLGKKIKLEIGGKSTPVDRDILEKLEAPLSHLLRNAIDHGIEPPHERLADGKTAEGLIKLEANHRGGMLAITVTDDGRGINIEQLRQKIVEKNLVSTEMASRLTESEVVDFLFLPGFSTAKEVSEISGRGVGLNIVRSVVQELGGIVETVLNPGKGASFHLRLPLTLSVMRTLLVEISGEIYAFPLAHIEQAFFLNRDLIEVVENRPYFRYEDQNIGLISAWEVLELNETQLNLKMLPIIVLSDRINFYGLVVDRLIGERELVVLELDARLGKVLDISAGALMEDGQPVLIIDVDTIVRSIDLLLSGERLAKVSYSKALPNHPSRKRILVVDDSLTVREIECRLLQNQGYEVETAVNGVEGWNAIRTGNYDLVITDVDMPRMDGIELVKTIKKDPRFKNLPIMIVSYKEGEEDRLKGLEAGADYYLAKSSFHDTTLLDAVNDLIGKANT